MNRHERRTDPEGPGPVTARKTIIDAANLFLSTTTNRVLSQRHLQEAVCIVRRRLLVSNDTLTAAGFNPVPPAPQRRAEPWGGRSSYTPKKVRR